MKKLLYAIPAFLFLAACGGSSSDKAATGDQQEAAAQTGSALTIDTTATTVSWKAAHKGGMAPRWGVIKVTSGSLSVDKDSLTGGEFVVNMASLKVDSASVTEKDKKATDLEGHLKSADFFDVAKYPTAKFVITKVEEYDAAKQKSLLDGANRLISGNLTLRDSTVNITFPAKVEISETGVTAAAKFTIDRSAWGISYKTEGSPENWVIAKDVEIGLNLKADKK